MTAEVVASPPVWRREVRAFGELLALFGFALTQPLLDLFGRGPEQFAARGASPAQILLFAVAIAFGPALLVWVVEVLVGAVNGRARQVVHAGVVFVLVAAVVLQAARPLTVGAPLVALAVAIGAGVTVAYLLTGVVRLFLAFAAAAPVFFLVLFVFASPTSELLIGDPGAADVDVTRPAPVVMLVFDELPLESLLTANGDIDESLYPNIAELAGDSHWFRNTTTVASSTWHAVPSILTGTLPVEGSSPVASQHPDNLFTLLAGSHEMHVTETVSRMCPVSVCPPQTSNEEVWRGLAGDAKRVMRSKLSPSRPAEDPVAGFADVSNGEDEFMAFEGTQPGRFNVFLDSLDDDGNDLHFLHLLLPHVPFRYLPSGNVYEATDPDLGRIPGFDTWTAEPWTAGLSRQRHLLQLQYVDGLVGQLVDELRATGRYDDSLVVLTADHGISFRPDGPIRGIQGQTLDEDRLLDVAWVPLFMKEPGQTEGDVSDDNVLTIDVLPTIADVLGIELPYPVDGQSALGSPRTSEDKPFRGTDLIDDGVALLDPQTIDSRDLQRMLSNTAEAFVPDLGDPWRLYRTGPAADLVGQRVADLRPSSLRPQPVELDDPAAFSQVPHAGDVPAFVWGHVPDGTVGSSIAVAVNGVIAATGPVFLDHDAPTFAVMIDDGLLHAGPNEVEVYAIAG